MASRARQGEGLCPLLCAVQPHLQRISVTAEDQKAQMLTEVAEREGWISQAVEGEQCEKRSNSTEH